MTRFELIDHRLARQIAAADPNVLRKLAVMLSEYAIAQTGLRDPLVDSALRCLRDEDELPSELVELTALVEHLDNRQWDLQERVDAGDASPDEQLYAFCQARAADALTNAFAPDPVTAASETAYEALVATTLVRSVE